MCDIKKSKIVEVSIKHKSRYVDRLFSYEIFDDVKIGQRVEVPFGKGNKLHEGIVVNIIDDFKSEKGIEYKQVSALKSEVSLLSETSIELAKWIKTEYMCSFFEALSLFLPKSESASFKYRRILYPIVDSEQIKAYKEIQRKNAKNKILLLDVLEQGPVDIMQLQETEKIIFSSAIKQLEADKIAIVKKEIELRKPSSLYSVDEKHIILNSEQQKVYDEISNLTLSRKVKLIHGVTGSGKTEIYIKLIEDKINLGKSAIVLVPEISLTPQTIARFKNKFGDNVALIHSSLSEGERKDQWAAIEQGLVDIVIGARSAVFAPLKNLGIIIIDECHDDAYKSEQNPKYDTIDLAEKMMEYEAIDVVIGTATPTIEQYYRANIGRYELFELKHRANAKLPDIEIIDTIDELRTGNNSLINGYIKAKIQTEIDKENQVIIFLNKRGFAHSLSCIDCKTVIKCPNCDITLNYHSVGNKLMCHYCGFTKVYNGICDSCGGTNLREIGSGTQKIEQEIKTSIEGAITIRVDKDTVSRKGSYENMLLNFKEKKANILIGTQMISKGLDFGDVTLVVVLNADQNLRFPDYRSCEKTFSIVSQVAGRSGRGDKEGNVIVQTIDSENEVFEYIKNNDYKALYDSEIKLRELFKYPPFGTLIRIVSSSVDSQKAANTSEKIKNAVGFYLSKKNLKIEPLGPAPCIISRIDKKYRWQLFYKVKDDFEINLIKSIINFILSEKRSIIIDGETSVSVDINPNNIM